MVTISLALCDQKMSPDAAEGMKTVHTISVTPRLELKPECDDKKSSVRSHLHNLDLSVL